MKTMNYRNIILVIASVIVLIAITFIMYKQSVDKVVQPLAEQPTTIVQTEPQKTDFGSKIPSEFPTDIPIEEGAEVQQSYSLNYAGQNQLTIVFPSTKTVKENYALYADFLNKQQWNITNKYESAKLSSLYATKESSDINVTISENTSSAQTKSQVSISVLKK